MPLGAPATIVPCKDGHVWMLALEPGQWNGLASVMGNPDWMQLEMFQDMFTRAQNADAIYPLIEEWTMEHGKQRDHGPCQEAGCPITAVFDVAEAAEHPHLTERGYSSSSSTRSWAASATWALLSSYPTAPAARSARGAAAGRAQRRGARPTARRLRRRNPKPAPDRRAFRDGKRASPGGDPRRELRLGVGRAGDGPDPRIPGRRGLQDRVPARVDLTRGLPPFAGGERDPDRSLSNHACWAGNGSVTLNLKREEARDLARGS